MSEEPETALSAFVTTLGIFGAATIGAFLTHVPPIGFVAGGIGAFVMLSGLTSYPGGDLFERLFAERCTLTLGADGFRVNDEFHAWLSVRGVSVSDGLTIELFNGTKWRLQTDGEKEAMEVAKTRIQWALRAPTYTRRVTGGYRTSARAPHSERTGLPETLRMSNAMSKRLEDFRRLDSQTRLQVLEAMANLHTRTLYLNCWLLSNDTRD